MCPFRPRRPARRAEDQALPPPSDSPGLLGSDAVSADSAFQQRYLTHPTPPTQRRETPFDDMNPAGRRGLLSCSALAATHADAPDVRRAPCGSGLTRRGCRARSGRARAALFLPGFVLLPYPSFCEPLDSIFRPFGMSCSYTSSVFCQFTRFDAQGSFYIHRRKL